MSTDISFEAWMAQVNLEIGRIVDGLSSDDLPDECWFDMYQDETDADEAAKQALKDAGYPTRHPGDLADDAELMFGPER